MQKPRLTGRRAVWFGLLATPVIVLVAIATISVAGAGAKSAKVQVSSAAGDNAIHQQQVSTAAVEAFWTPERMAQATPMVKTLSAAQAKATIAGDTATGPPGVAGGFKPGDQPVVGPNLASAPTTSGGILPADGGYPGPHASFKWYPSYLAYPQGNIGRMFFQQDADHNGTYESYSCSASVVYTGGNTDSVMTAGHCMNNGTNGLGLGAGWSTNVLFCPSYINGANPTRGCWAWDGYGIVRTPWYVSGDFEADWGGFHTAATGSVIANHIANVTGGLGFAWNWGRDQLWWDWGYPALPNPPFNGGALVLCTSEHRYDVNTGGFGPDTNSIGCSMGRGSSGGPWVTSLGQQNAFPIYVNSVNSWLYLAEEGHEIQGPYAETTACGMMDTLTGWPGTC